MIYLGQYVQRRSCMHGVRLSLSRSRAWPALFLALGLCLAGPARADGALKAWRAEAEAVRLLAENSAPRAHAAAVHLQATLPEDGTPADKAKALNLLARAEIYLGQAAPAGRHAGAALELASKHNDRIGQAEAELNIALNAVNQGRIDLLPAATSHSVAVLEGVDRPDLLAEAMLRTAMMYQRMGKLEESVTMTMQAMELASVTKEPLALTYAHQGLAVSMVLNGRLKEGRVHYEAMLEQARAAGSKMLQAYALNGIGNIDVSQGAPKQAEAAIRQAIELFRAAGAPFGASHARFALAGLLRSQGRNAEALPILDEVAALYARFDNHIGLWYTLNARSTLQNALGNPRAAMADAERGYALAQQLGVPSYQSESAQQLAALAAAQGDKGRAYTLSAEAAALTSAAAKQRANTRVIELAQRYETDSRKRQIGELTRRNEQQLAELRQHALQQRWMWTVIAASLALLALTGVFLLRLRRTHAIIRHLNAGLEQRVQARTDQLRQQTRYLRTLIDTLPGRVWLKDTGSRYRAVNQAAAETCGLSADELIGKSDLEVRPRAQAEAVRADDLAIMTARRRKTVEGLQRGPGGQASWMETFTAPVLDEDGSVLGIVGFARDISARKAAETARAGELAEAQRLAGVRSEFLAHMSHQLRNPLNSILGHAQLLRRDRTLNEQQRAGVAVIEQEGEHLATLIDGILDMARIEAGMLELSIANVPLRHCLHGIGESVRDKADHKRLEFICDIGADVPGMLLADERRLRQVLLKLLDNAVQFTERGHVCLRVRCSAPGRLRFEVEDSGIGIDDTQREAIFAPFARAGGNGRRFGGSGLGLAVTRQFVRLMGGELQLESAPGKGSLFWFELNADPAHSAMPALPHDQQVIGYAGERQTILVLDEVAAHRGVAAAMLERLGFIVTQAADADAAVAAAQARRPSLLLIDMAMPRMDGLAALQRLRALPGMAAVPAIAVSASALGQDEERALAGATNAFLAKPLDLDALVAHIARLLQLALIYEAAGEAVPDEMAHAMAVLPPHEQLAAMLELARLGNMQELRQWAGQLEELDERYRPLADHVRRLAGGYQSKAILTLARRCLQASAAPAPLAAAANQ